MRNCSSLVAACFFAASACLTLADTPPAASSTAQSPVAAPAAPSTLSDRFGVCSHLTWQGESPADLATIAAAGFSMVRDGEEWGGIEKAPGLYVVRPVGDQLIEQAGANGVQPLYILAFANKIYPNNVDPDKYADYANWMIEHYAGKVKYWELWNEPHNFVFKKQFGGTWNGVEKDGSESPWVGKFADFITKASAKIKAAHPEVKLLTGTSGVVDVRLLRDHPHMWDNIDILAIHSYTYRLPPEIQPYGGDKIKQRDGVEFAGDDHSFESQIQIYRKLLAGIGKPQMPIWVTEMGYSTFSPKKPSTLWAGFSEPAQAAYDVRFGILSASLGIDRTFFYCLRDSGKDEGEVEHHFGLLHRDGSPKPSYTALQRLTSLLPGDSKPADVNVKVNRPAPSPRNDTTTWDDAVIQMLDTPQAHLFTRPDGERVLFVWRAGRIYGDVNDERCDIDLPADGKTWNVVSAGHVVSGENVDVKAAASNGTIKLSNLTLTSDPIFIRLHD